MGGIYVDAGFRFGFEPAAQNTAAWKDERVNDTTVVDDRQAQIAIERRRGDRLPDRLLVLAIRQLADDPYTRSTEPGVFISVVWLTH
jgi:hypothetical protein